MHSFLYYYLIFINCTAFVVYGADKGGVQLNRSCAGSGEVQRRHAYDECPQKFRQTDP